MQNSIPFQSLIHAVRKTDTFFYFPQMLAAIASRGHGVKRKKGKEVDKTQKTLLQAFGGKK